MSKKKSTPKWFAGKRYSDGHIEIAFGFWKDPAIQSLFQFQNHSHVRGFTDKLEAEKWVYSLAPAGSEMDLEHELQLTLDNL